MQQVGPYRILSVLGEGGMGTVYRAEQEYPVRRPVALKVVKRGIDSQAVLRRFEQERQAIAVMSHDAIARVFDAGTTEDGQPYFVMELVEGLPITDYCEAKGLSTEARIVLFQRVCHGVQHAHQKGVIHRDIKPSNVLVDEKDGEPLPKIIDFGLARATDEQQLGSAMHTEHGQVLGTPEYMSPEQARGNPDAIDTRSDIYSLGVLLYELLAGQLPFTRAELREAGILEALRKIREDEPPAPSHKAATTRALATRALRGDLDWIVMRAIAKEPDRRYSAASELAADLGRYLAHEPVLAGPPSASYRLRKLLRRYRGQVAALAGVLVVLVGGLIAFALANGRASANARRAEREATTANAIRSFLVELFEASSPYEARGQLMTIRQYLDLGAERLAQLDGEPQTQAELCETIGYLYTLHSEFGKARPLLEQAIRHREALEAEDPTALARSLHLLAMLCSTTDRYADGETLIRRALAIHERELGDHVNVADNLNVLGILLQRQGKLAEAQAAHERALALRERLLPAGDADVAQSWHNLGIVRYSAGDLEGAARCYERSMAIEEAARGKDSHDRATSLHTLAIVYQELWRLDEAKALELESLALREKILGPEHDHVALSLATLGVIERQLGQLDPSVQHLRRAVAISTKNLEPTNSNLGWQKRQLAWTLVERGDFEDAEPVLAELTAAAGSEPLALAAVHGLRGELHLRQQRPDEARAEFERMRALCARESAEAAAALGGLARVQAMQGELDAARRTYRRAVVNLAEATSERDEHLLRLKASFATIVRGKGAAEEAATIEAEVEAARRSAPPAPETRAAITDR